MIPHIGNALRKFLPKVGHFIMDKVDDAFPVARAMTNDKTCE